MLVNYFKYIFEHLRQKSKSQGRIKPENYVNFRPEAGPNPTRKTQPDLQLCPICPFVVDLLIYTFFDQFIIIFW